jgi:hypothetical protein
MGEARRLVLKKHYWEQKREEIKKLEPFFYLCDRCNGIGATLTAVGRYGKAYEPCKKCNNEGKISWIENIFK